MSTTIVTPIIMIIIIHVVVIPVITQTHEEQVLFAINSVQAEEISPNGLSVP